jgi:N-acetylornithine carbamoyltransferase
MTPEGCILGPADLPAEARELVLTRAAVLKRTDPAPRANRLRVGALYFNPSLRTRASFEQAVHVVGGSCQTLNASSDTWALELEPDAIMDGNKVENIAEAARVLGQFFHILGVRSFRGSAPWEVERTEPVIRRIAEYAGVPVISLEGATHHPCQSLADVLTMRETFGPNLSGLPVALTWAWHPKALPMAVPHSFLLQAALAGCDISLVHPEGFDLDADIVAQSRTAARAGGGDVTIHHDREAGVAGRQLVYVKSWGAMNTVGATDPSLRPWIVDEDLLSHTDAGKVMHCLPVRRNVVIASEVLDGPRSLVTQQAGNRLWAQAALVEHLARHHGVLA